MPFSKKTTPDIYGILREEAIGINNAVIYFKYLISKGNRQMYICAEDKDILVCDQATNI
ncbi:hypothetical protein NEPAR04_1404 [Nematocida parisii]|nr:hypothetical protein NEPAR04_1404 [Nematocida parisii]